MSLLVLNVCRVGRTILVQVAQQAKSIRCFEPYPACSDLYQSDKLQIKSKRSPQIVINDTTQCEVTLYLRGYEQKYNLDVASAQASTAVKAEAILKEIAKAVRQINTEKSQSLIKDTTHRGIRVVTLENNIFGLRLCQDNEAVIATITKMPPCGFKEMQGHGIRINSTTYGTDIHDDGIIICPDEDDISPLTNIFPKPEKATQYIDSFIKLFRQPLNNNDNLVQSFPDKQWITLK